MKFDVVVGNPPFQDSSHTEKKNTLWRKFLALSVHELVVDDGFVLLVLPSSWLGSRKLLEANFNPYNLLYINKDECKRHFSVGSTFSFFLLQKKEYQNRTSLKNKQISGSIVCDTVDLEKMRFGAYPRDLSSVCCEIIEL